MNILVTRPDERGQQLVNMLAERQIFAIHQPILRIEAGNALPQLPSVLARLNAGDYVFAVSKNAVDFAVKALKETGFRWRSDLTYLAVGQGTANYFCSQAELSVRYPIESENSEGLLNLAGMQNLANKQVVILRANTGREYFSEQVQLRGAKVETVECYRRLLWAEDLPEKMSLAKRSGIDTLVITSGEILSILFTQTLETDRDWLLASRLIVVGRRVANLAIKLGWQSDLITISEKADNYSLLESVLQGMKS
ncbi:uroporphyrinogen-III synthase [Bibersteinia trehalosi]|uniref:Uroporphyrinogen-III synthase n=1 Tax=Bibersteinia trehalosi TaxID=47735 RepID=A0A426FFG9_BIBTR|nr:uroporphyrinogen-III synthase [Bibersteinia trehalosi]RRN00978.1 uroporphyrinogen-III synthase [Bibersteinia trehalosi]